MVEQDHRFIKKKIMLIMGLKACHWASVTLAGIETAHMMRKGQLFDNLLPPRQQFIALAA